MTNKNTEEHQFTWHQKFFHQRDMMRKLMFIREFFIFIDVHSQTQQNRFGMLAWNVWTQQEPFQEFETEFCESSFFSFV